MNEMNRGYGGWESENGNNTYLYNTLKQHTFQDNIRITVVKYIISAMGQSWIFAKRKPVASTMNPPQALKSLTIEGIVSGKISLAQKKSTRKIVACGIATGDTVASGEQGKDHL